MEFSHYQTEAGKTAVYPQVGSNVQYPALGLAGEAGEICNQVKKIARDDAGVVSPERKETIKKELGDVLWYVAQLCTEFNVSLDDVAQHNLQKLASRKERGTLNGSGDNR